MNDTSAKQCLSSTGRRGICTEKSCKRDGVRFEAHPTTPYCFNQDSLEFESSYRIRSADVVTSQEGNL